jgi:hypothetical protein
MMRLKIYLWGLLQILLAGGVLAEGSKNLTPNSSGGSASGTNDYVGYLLHDAGTNSNGFLSPNAPADERMYVIVKPGETLYFGVQRGYALTAQPGNEAFENRLRIRLKYSNAGTTTSLYSVILDEDATNRNLLDISQAGVIDSYAQASVGPNRTGVTGGYDPLSWTNNTGSTVYLWVEFTNPTNGVAESDADYINNLSYYNLWDFTVVDANNVEKTGRLYSQQWAFSTSNFVNRLASTFSFQAAIPAVDGGYYVKKVNYFGAKPFEAIYVANSTGTDPNAHAGGTDFYDWRKSQSSADGFNSADIYPEYPLFINNPDQEFYPSASTQAISTVASNIFCDAGGNPRVALNLFSSKAGYGVIVIDLNKDGVLDPEDRVLEQAIAAGNNYFYWDGLDGTGTLVPSGTEILFTFRSNVGPVNFPTWDMESNNNGITVQKVRPGVNGTYEYLYYDDSNLDPDIVNVDPLTQVEGNNSAAGAHKWQDTSGDNTGGGNTRIMNTFSFGSVQSQTITFDFIHDCNPDFDGDGYTNDVDADNDNDGLSDTDELNGLGDPYGFDGASTTVYPRYLDFSLAGFIDYDNNGIDDRYDADGDGLLNINDTDSDGDGLWDARDANNYRNPNGRFGGYDDATGTTTGVDSDGNGMADGAEGTPGRGTVAGEWNINDTDGDGILDFLDLDSDNDGVLDFYEGDASSDSGGGRDYRDTDADGDGIYDVIEAGGLDTNNDGRLDSFVDLNQNGLHDGYESLMGGTDLGDPDSDGDGIVNRLDTDSDNDGIPDATEGNGDLDGDGVYNIVDLDSDNDGLYDVYEAGGTAGANARLSSFTDANNDGMDDATAASPLPLYNTDGNGNPDYLDVDSDGDGIVDAVEAGARDANGDGHLEGTINERGLAQSVDPTSGGRALTPTNTDGDSLPDYRDTDSDGDGFLDAVEGFDNNYDNAADISASGSDTDGDGLDDSFDTDNGGTASTLPDLDADGLPNYQDTDDDGDGTNSLAEGVGSGVVPNYLDNPSSQFVLRRSGGSPAVQTGNACYTLTTTATGNRAAAIWYSQQHNMTEGFVITANLNFGSLNNEGEGIAFVMHQDPNGTNALGGSGAGIGYSGIRSAVILEFDTDDDGGTDPANDHGAFLTSNNAGALARYGTLNLGELEDGEDHVLSVTYNASSDIAIIEFDGIRMGEVPNLGAIFGRNPIYWGFTSATSNDDANNQSVCGITYTVGSSNDSDGDGISDVDDPDDDGDGISDIAESYGSAPDGDHDFDGVYNFADPDFTTWADSNGDGINDLFDIDLDGILNHLDLDSDNDGIRDEDELNADTDGDGRPNYLDTDSDNDGIADAIEAGGADSNGDGIIDGFFDYNDNGLADMLDPAEGNPSLNPTDTDGDSIADYLDLDSDNDGIADASELYQNDFDQNGRVDSFTDANYNGWHDGLEGNAISLNDIDGDGLPNHLDLDSDGDNVSDRLENGESDAGNDGVADSFTDNDGDGWHDNYIYNTITLSDWDGDGSFNFADLDSDNDGILDEQEAVSDAAYTPPTMLGGKGTSTARVMMPSFTGTLVDTDSDGIADIYDVDSDNDGISDAVEAGGNDENGDGIIDNFTDNSGDDGLHDALSTSPLAVADTDSDGAHDFRDRDSDGDGQADWVEAYDADGDGDSLPEYLQYSIDYADYTGDNPYDNDLDADSDGIPDWLEDDDADGLPNFQDPDNSYFLDANNNGLADLYDAAYGGVEDKPNNAGFTDSGSVTTLPVELVAFEAYEQNGTVVVYWETASETNSSHYVVQRSADGLNYYDIEMVEAAGNSQTSLTYQIVDRQPLAGMSYYRLLQVDVDGQSELYDPVRVEIQVTWEAAVYPNPAIAGQKVELRVQSEQEQSITLEVYDMNGTLHWSGNRLLSGGTQRIEIPARVTQKPGMYLIKVTNQLNQQTLKFIRH